MSRRIFVSKKRDVPDGLFERFKDTGKSRGDLNSLKDALLGEWQTNALVEMVDLFISVAEHSVLKNATLRFSPCKYSFSR